MSSGAWKNLPIKCVVSTKDLKKEILTFTTYSIDTGLLKLKETFGENFIKEYHFIFSVDRSK